MSKNTQYSFFAIPESSDSSSALDYCKRPVESSKDIFIEDDHEYNLGFDSLLANLKKDSLKEDSIYEGEEDEIHWDEKPLPFIPSSLPNEFQPLQNTRMTESHQIYNMVDFGLSKSQVVDPNNYLNLDNLKPEKNDQVRTVETDKVLSISKKIHKPFFVSTPQTQLDQPKFVPKRIHVDLSRKKKTKRRAWLQTEDEKVLDLVNKYGQAWALIASKMNGRTGKQVRDRYVNKLKPDIKNNEWTEAEDKKLLALHNQFGHKWSKISSLLPGRTEGQVKNRFYTFLKTKVSDTSDSSEATQTTTQPPSPTSNFSEQIGQYLFSRPQFPQSYNTSNIQAPYIPQRFDMNNQLSSGYSQNFGQSGNVPLPQERTGYSYPKPSNTDLITKNVIDNTLKMIATYVDTAALKKNEGKGYKGLIPGYQQIANPKAEMLQIRKKNLEFLLAKTLEEINSCN